MLTYEQLDWIADAYTPLLALTVFYSIFKTWQEKNKRRVINQVTSLILGMLVVYGIYFLDGSYRIWLNWDLDYSTHTAFALVFVIHYAAFCRNYVWLQLSLFTGYLLLMVYQNYHSFADILTTGFMVGVLFFVLIFRLSRKSN